MSIQFTCPTCPTSYKVPDQLAGRKASCRSCDTSFVVPSPFSAKQASAAAAEAKAVASGKAAKGGKLGGRPFSLLGAIGAVALMASVGLPWVQGGITPASVLTWPADGSGIAPYHLMGTGTGPLALMGLDMTQTTISPIAKYALFIVPLIGLIILLREVSTFGSGRVPRMAYVCGAVLPLLAVVFVAFGLASPTASVLAVDEGTTAYTIGQQVSADVGDGATPMKYAMAGASVFKSRLSLGAVVCAAGMLLCLIAAFATKSGSPKAAAATAGTTTGENEPKTMTFRAESPSAGRTSVLNASAAAATDAALAALAKRNGGSPKASATSTSVGTAAAIEAALKAVDGDPATSGVVTKTAIPMPEAEPMPPPKDEPVVKVRVAAATEEMPAMTDDEPPATTAPAMDAVPPTEPLGSFTTPVSQRDSAVDLTDDMRIVDAAASAADPFGMESSDAMPLPEPVSTPPATAAPPASQDFAFGSDPFAGAATDATETDPFTMPSPTLPDSSVDPFGAPPEFAPLDTPGDAGFQQDPFAAAGDSWADSASGPPQTPQPKPDEPKKPDDSDESGFGPLA